jgi:DNA-binding LacI/PurR family transcriptional regulator
MSLKSIALELGISPSTVSRVINGKKNFSVSDELRKRILQRVDEKGYNPNPIYQSMRQKQNQQISILLPNLLHDMSDSTRMALDRIRAILISKGYSIHFLLHTLEDGKIYQLPPWKVSGAIVVDIRVPELVSELDTSGIPYVSINGVSGPNGTAVMADEYGNMQKAMQYLYDLGHRRIGYLNLYRPASVVPFTMNEHHYSVIQRTGAYLDFCSQHNLSVMPESANCNHSLEEAMEAGLRQNMTAFVTYSNISAIELEHHLHRKGLRIPEDVGIITFNESSLLKFTHPPLSCIDIHMENMADRTAEIILKKTEEPEYMKGQQLSFSGELIIRDSAAAIQNNKLTK